MPELVQFSGRHMLTVSLENSQPVDLVDLTTSLMAVAQEFQDFTDRASGDAAMGNVKLFVRNIRSGSVIADLIPIAQQADWLLDHKDIVGAFVGNLNDIAGFFLGRSGGKQPTREEAKRLAQIIEPVAKDGGSQLNIQASDQARVEIHNHFHIGSVNANAVQNGIRRFLGPDLPALEIRRDQLLVLEQVKNVASSKTGDRAVIEAIWPRAVKLQFLSDEAKAKVLTLEENPFQRVFLVDVEVHSVGGKPVLYRVVEVKESLEKP